MPRNSLPNGESAPDTGGLQLDECSYPILMDWQSGLAGDRQLYLKHVIPAADFVVAHGPSDGSERWEEQSGYSPSTIAAEIAGLTAAAAIARVQGDIAHARLYQATADDFARNIKSWTVTTSGPYRSTQLLHPGLKDGRSERGRSRTTSATEAARTTSARSSTPASSSWFVSACFPQAIRTSRPRSR